MDNEKLLNLIERQIFELRRDYDLYFSGEHRRPPEKLRNDVKKNLLSLQDGTVTNTQQRFRVQALQSRFSSFTRHWDSIMYQIEKGTYKPDQFKADMRVGRFSADSGKVEKSAERVPKRFQLDAEDAAERKTKDLYKTFIETRRVTGESTKLGYDTFKNSIDKNRDILKKKLGNNFDLKIAIESGKAKVKGVSRK